LKIRVCTTIDVTPAQLWRHLERIEDHVEWMTDARTITFVGRARHGVGTEFDCYTVVGPLRTTDRMVVTEWEPRRAMGIVHRGVVTGRGRFTLKRRRGGRTRFCWEERLQLPWWTGGPVAAVIAKPVLRAVWRRNLAGLKALAEAANA
jgi:hypothetical protein